jgi:AcrR family transcriptional regulator
MVGSMKKNSPQTKERILLAAQKEFAARGYSGTRMEAIARGAGSNKAMLFYYFSSKDNLYQTVLHRALVDIFSEIGRFITPAITPEIFLEKFPEIYIRFFARNPDFVRIMVFDLIHNPENVTAAMAEIIHEKMSLGPKPLLGLIKRWHGQGLISEADPLHFMMNIVALSIFSFIGKPMVEAISGIKVANGEDYYRKRIESVINILKRGMLK